MDSFIISYLSGNLNAEIRVIHMEKNTTCTIQIFFSLIYILYVAITSKKHTKKRDHHSRFIAKRQQRDNFRFK